MMEIKYHDGQEQSEVKLPNNIRQVGMPEARWKIYIEDYVQTYLNKMSQSKDHRQQAAILLGKKVKKDQNDIFFISAAIRLKDVDIENDMIRLTPSKWEKIYEESDRYFEGLKMLGWFLSRPGQGIHLNQTIEKVHLEQFNDKGNLYYAMDMQNQEAAFYLYLKNRLIRQTGYYIYYEKNEAMQNYMIDEEKKSQEKENQYFSEDMWTDAKTYFKHAPIKKKARKKKTRWISQVAALVLLIVVAVTVKNQWLPVPLDSENVISLISETETTEETMQTGTVDIIENIMRQAEETILEIETAVNSETETEEVAYILKQYTVKEGDTLLSISRAYYGHEQGVEQIIRLNQIENPDYIYPGLVLQIP